MSDVGIWYLYNINPVVAQISEINAITSAVMKQTLIVLMGPGFPSYKSFKRIDGYFLILKK